MKYYKIKIGIEDYPCEEEDIPRIVEAMKNSDIVKLECGLFRGHAINAVVRDIEKENRLMLAAPKEKTPEEIKKEEDLVQLKKQMEECKTCGKTGFLRVKKDFEWVATPCICTIIAVTDKK